MPDDKLSLTTGWQPIGTAPRDGTHVLLWGSSSIYTGPDQVVVGHFSYVSEAWEISFDCAPDFAEVRASHWMPLPKPPHLTDPIPVMTPPDPVATLRQAITDLIPLVRYLGAIARHEGQDRETTEKALDIAYGVLRATNNAKDRAHG